MQRTTASAGWMTQRGSRISAVTLGYGVNVTDHGTRHAMLAEATRREGPLAVFGRFEVLQPEVDLLLQGAGLEPDGRTHALTAFTTGVVRDVVNVRGFEGAVGGEVTFYAVPEVLRSTHGDHPVSFQLFFRLRAPAPMGRMWNMRMSQPPMGRGMSH
jgi:hypothetical protein